MKLFTFVFTSLFLLPAIAQTEVPIDSLGKLNLTYVNAAPSQSVQKSVSTGIVAPLPGSQLHLMAPMTPQQVQYLVADGTAVSKGQKLAMLKGSEVHHFTENLKAKTALLKISQKRFNANKPLFEANAISQSSWFSIAQAYYDAKLAWGHLDHFAEMFESDEDDDIGYLLAPEAGLFLYANGEKDAEATRLGSIISNNSLRIKTMVSADEASLISAIETANCQVQVARTDAIVNGYLTSVWSEPLPESCNLKLGQRAQVNGHFKLKALKIPAQSVFYLNGQSSVFVRSGNVLNVVPVEVVGQSGADALLIKATPQLNNQPVLSSSVSAVQGVLIGLGEME